MMLVSLIDKRLSELMAEQAMLTELKTQLEPFEKKVIELCSPVRVVADQVVGTVKHGPNGAGNHHLFIIRSGETRCAAMCRHVLAAFNDLPRADVERATLKHMIIPKAPADGSLLTLFTRALRELAENRQIQRAGHGLYRL